MEDKATGDSKVNDSPALLGKALQIWPLTFFWHELHDLKLPDNSDMGNTLTENHTSCSF